MAKPKKKPSKITALEKVLMAMRTPIGTYPGQNRARVFRNRRKVANKYACRGPIKT